MNSATLLMVRPMKQMALHISSRTRRCKYARVSSVAHDKLERIASTYKTTFRLAIRQSFRNLNASANDWIPRSSLR